MLHRFKIILLIFVLYGCEDVITVDLPDPNIKLVVNAIIEVDLDTDCTPFVVYTSLSSGFYDENNPVSVSSVRLIIESYNDFGDTESSTTTVFEESSTEVGKYEAIGVFDGGPTCIRPDRSNTELGYFLSIIYNGRNYFARTKYAPATTIDSLEQGNETLADDDDKELIVTFTDDPNIENLYIFNYGKGNFITTDDDFFQGQQYSFSYFLDDQYKSGETVEVTLLGADREFFNYMNLLIDQTDDDFNLFDTPAATIRGNIFDITDIDNRDQFDNVEATNTFALGYFAIVESSTKSIVLE